MAQFPDQVIRHGVTYDLAGVAGAGLVSAQELGIVPGFVNKGVARGCLCTYALDDALVLTRALVGGDSTHQGAPISPGAEVLGGRVVQGSGRLWRECLVVEGLSRSVGFSGALLLGAGFAPSTYVPLDFHPAWRYATVLEAELESGRLTGLRDRSAEVAALRDGLAERPGEVRAPEDRELLQQVLGRAYVTV